MASKRPKQVSDALLLLWIVVGGGVVFATLNFSNSLEIADAAGLGILWLILTLYFTFLLLAFFIWKIGEGRNWARMMYSILFVIGLPFTIYSHLASDMSLLSTLWALTATILQVVAIVFLFQKPSSKWFASTK